MDGKKTRQEHATQSEAWRSVLNRKDKFPEGNGTIIFFGAGAALAAAKTLAWSARKILKRPAYAISSQDLFLNEDIIPTLNSELFVAISRTGDVTDNNRAARAIKRKVNDARLITIVGETGLDLGDVCDETIELKIMEDSVATTKTFSSMVLAGQVMMYRAKRMDIGNTLGKLPDKLDEITPRYQEVVSDLKDKEFDQIVFLGTGSNLGMAHASALAVLEMSVERSIYFQSLVYLHGPCVTTTQYKTLVVTYLSDKQDEELKALKELNQDNTTIVTIGNGVKSDYIDIDLKTDIPEVERSVVHMPFGQMLGMERSLSRGFNPENPPDLLKVF